MFEYRCNMQEYLYNFLVMEYIEPGIHPEVHKEEWYVWDSDYVLPENQGHGKWLRVEKPLEFENVTNFALG